MKDFRWFPAVVGGLLCGFAIYFPISMLAGSPQLWVLPAGWGLVGWWAGKGRHHAWGRVWLVMALASFALPLSSLVFGAHITSEAVNTATGSAEQAGAVIGGGMATAVVSWFGAFVGFFLGIIFALLAYFNLLSKRD